MSNAQTNLKTCTGCGNDKPLSEFSRTRVREWEGLRSKCRPCINKYRRRYTQNNLEATRRYYRARRPPKHRDRNIYFIQMGTGGPVKIGMTIEPYKRLKNLQSNSPYTLELLLTYPATVEEEWRLYELFKTDRLLNGWFQFSDALKAFIHQQDKIEGDKNDGTDASKQV